MSDTAEYFETDEPEVIEKPKKIKKTMSPSKKKALLERLAKGREKATLARKSKQKKAKQMLEKPDEPIVEPVAEPVVEPLVETVVEPVKKVRKAREKKVKIIDDQVPQPYTRYKDSEEYKYMKNKIDSIADYMKQNTIKEIPTEVIKEKPIEVAKVAKVNTLPHVEKPTLMPVMPKIASFSTLRNKKRKKFDF